jgi:hypothetical protein
MTPSPSGGGGEHAGVVQIDAPATAHTRALAQSGVRCPLHGAVKQQQASKRASTILIDSFSWGSLACLLFNGPVLGLIYRGRSPSHGYIATETTSATHFIVVEDGRYIAKVLRYIPKIFG